MKKITLAALALLLVASVASAKVLVVTERLDSRATTTGGETVPQSAYLLKMQDRMIAACVDVFNMTGMTYDIVPVSATRTRWLASGRSVTNWTGFNSDSSYTQYDAVIILNANGRTLANGVTVQRPWPPSQTGCYPCSLTTVKNYPKVPVLFLFGATNASSNNQNGGPVGAWSSIGTGAAVCSTGVTHTAGSTAMPNLHYPAGFPTSGWLSASNIWPGGDGSGLLISSATSAATPGGVRALLTVKSSPLHLMMSSVAKVTPAWVDSFKTGGGADTVTVWERPMVGWAGTGTVPANAHLVFANIMGSSGCVDSIETNFGNGETNIPCEFDAPTLLFALAHLDSLAGGKVWDKSTSKLPLRAAVTIDGAFTRAGRMFAGGAYLPDSSVLKATLDSLNTLGVPLTVGVNVDSIASYPYEIAWWNKLSNARISPQAWVGVDRFAFNPAYQSASTTTDTTAYANLNWSSSRPVDVFGRYRNRAFLGDSTTLHTVAGSDSSVLQGLLAIRSIARTYFPNRALSGLLMAPRDDYSPKNAFDKVRWLDSLVYVARLAGFSCIRTNVQAGDADPGRFRGNVKLLRGGVPTQGFAENQIGGGQAMSFLGHAGHSISGSQYLANVRAIDPDTAAALTEYYGTTSGVPTTPIPNATVGRFWHGFVHDIFTDEDWFPNRYNIDAFTGVVNPREDNFSPMRHASILKMHVSDFGGIPNGPPKRPGWWAVKSLANSFAAINAKAGRPVCVFDWPENIVP